MCKSLLERKLEELFSGFYRRYVFYFVRISLEHRTGSILKSGSYVRDSVLEGKNYLGRNTVLRRCRLGFGSYVNNNGDFTDAVIGRYTSIGANVSCVIGKHPLSVQAAMHPAFTNPEKIFGYSYVKEKNFKDTEGHIEIGNDVWIGNNVLIMDGVKIGDGAVIGTGALVTKDIEPYSINAGIPARKLRYRFDEKTRERLLKLRWWDRGEVWIRKHIDAFRDAGMLLKTTEADRKAEDK